MSRFAFAPPPIHCARLLALFALACIPAASAQDDFTPSGPANNGSTDENQRLRAVPGAPGAYEFGWWGRAGRTYFVQRSADLVSPWEYFPVIEKGGDAAISYGFVSDSPRVFVRLLHIAGTDGDPYSLDSDGDGLSNRQEFDARTDPFSADTDRDGMPDKWETDHGLDPRNPSDALADPNGNGVSNLDEYLNGNDPRLLAYGGLQPLLQIVSGNLQTPRSGEFLPLPMRVQIRRPDGTPWAGVPIHFKAGANEGLLSVTPDGRSPLRQVLTVVSDQNGYGQAWLKTP